MSTRADRLEIELVGEQEDHCFRGGQARVLSACFSLGGLEQPVERFKKSVGLAESKPDNDAVKVVSNHLRDRLHWLDFETHDVGPPLQEHSPNEVDLLALQNLAQLFSGEPGPRGCARTGLPSEQLLHIGTCFGPGRVGLTQEVPADPHEFGFAFLLDLSYLVDGLKGFSNGMKCVESDLGGGQIVANAADKGRRDVNAARLDRLRISAVSAQKIGQLGNYAWIFALDDGDHRPLLAADGQRPIFVSLRLGALIDGQLPELGQIAFDDRLTHIARTGRNDAVDQQRCNPCHAMKRHLLGEQQDQGLDQQCESGQLACPVGLNLPHAAVGQLEPRHAHVQEALVLGTSRRRYLLVTAPSMRQRRKISWN